MVNDVGTDFGSRSEFIKACSEALTKDTGGKSSEGVNLCGCMLDVILELPSVRRSKDPDVIYKSDPNEAMAKDSAVAGRFRRCILKHAVDDSLHLAPLLTGGTKDEVVKTCSEVLRQQANAQLASYDLDVLCNCLFDQMAAHDLTLADLPKAQDPNSPLFNEVMVPCMDQAMIANTGPVEVTGPPGPVQVPVIAMANLHKVKVRIGGTENYFIIDSGANDCFISTALADQLRTKGAFSEEDRLPDQLYAMADGTQVTCERYKVKGVALGPYTVNGATFAVLDMANVQFLLGKSILGRFKEWRIDAATNTLVLAK